MMIKRREVLLGSGALAASSLALANAGSAYVPPPLSPIVTDVVDPKERRISLDAAERFGGASGFGGKELPLWTFSDDPLPVVRLRLGNRLTTEFRNNLPRAGEHTSIHWHGLRKPSEQGGVPYVVKPPIDPGETFTYSFVPPDAGTFFFHTHCNTAEQLARGLAGILIAEGDDDTAFDADELLVLKDWRINDVGQFTSFFTKEGANKRGTFGAIRSCNGATNPEVSVPASGDVRLRIVNVDNSRVMMLGITGAEAFVVAVDGIACPPFPLETWMTGPAMRFDVVVRTPEPGKTAQLVDYFAPSPVPLATLVATGAARKTTPFEPVALRAGRIAEADLSSAEKRAFSFSSAPSEGALLADADDAFTRALMDELCLSFEPNWSINKTVWPGRGHQEMPPPLTTLEHGNSYVFELKNVSPVHHLIHIHGHTFRVLKSNKRKRLPEHHSDTVLLAPKERVTVSFVADNPGDWIFHCHLIEHQESGMMSYIRVA